ncbi:MAG TPA: maleylpyruvate isomerase N-terminal domain-containing protein [Candidatus Limnocylindrales bacterium]|nr:maleylpyruvate isomerase N-terminal domain-containing protein [Candidatus Limnocylindrales bacterium]
MAIDRTYIARNDRERARLKALVSKASDADLARPMPDGWTIAGVLLHMAFWDQRIVVLLDKWEREGVIPRLEEEGDVDWTNDSAKPMLLAVPPRRAAQLAVEIADAVDAHVAAARDEIVARNEYLNFSRADHRGEHLDEIEAALRG